MKKISYLAFFVTLIFFNTNVFSQTNFKFGHIDSQLLLNAMPETDSAQLKLENYIRQIEAQIETMDVEYNTKVQDYADNRDTYTDFLRQTKEDEINDLNQRIQTFRSNANTEIQMKQAEFFQPVIDKARNAIRDVAKENGFTYIFDISEGTGIVMVLYYSEDNQDIFPLVKNKLGIE